MFPLALALGGCETMMTVCPMPEVEPRAVPPAFERLSVGMTSSDVEAAVGLPDRTLFERDADTDVREVREYRAYKTDGVTGSAIVTYYIAFHEEKVTRWGTTQEGADRELGLR
jgi:hypothetical protein